MMQTNQMFGPGYEPVGHGRWDDRRKRFSIRPHDSFGLSSSLVQFTSISVLYNRMFIYSAHTNKKKKKKNFLFIVTIKTKTKKNRLQQHQNQAEKDAKAQLAYKDSLLVRKGQKGEEGKDIRRLGSGCITVMHLAKSQFAPCSSV